MSVKALIADFKAHASADSEPMAKYMRNQFPFLGIKSPQRRSLSSPYLREWRQTKVVDWETVETLWQQDEREFQYVAADYLQMMRPYLQAEDLPRFKTLLITKSWWDSVDALVKTVGYLVAKYPQLKSTILAWSVAENIWLRRTAIINQLNMKEKTNTDFLRAAIENNLGQSEFFINKAIGWALRDYSKTNPSWVIELLRQHREAWDKVTWREATKYIEVPEA